MTGVESWQPDARLDALARTVRGRIAAPAGAAVVDDSGRVHASAEVTLAGRRYGALLLACAQAAGAGAGSLRAGIVWGPPPGAEDLTAASALVEPGGELVIGVRDDRGELVARTVLRGA